jgi:putative tricarboxylic transport membrane protein
MQSIFQANRYFDQPITIQNKLGPVVRAYLNQFQANGHYLNFSGQDALASDVLGRSVVPYTEMTPVAILYGDYIGIAVKADSPIKSGRDLIERLKKDPTAHSIGLATYVGGINHQAVAGALKSAGVDIRRTRNVTFSSGAAAITAMLGGHIDVVRVSVGLWASHMTSGSVRVIAVSSPERQPGIFAPIPTWREQGANSVAFNWRAMFGPTGMTPQQVAFWEATFQRLIATQEWKDEMVLRNGVSQFTGAARMKKRMQEEYPEIKAFMTELGLAKN